MSPGPTFDRVYYELKAQLTAGRFAPGEHLEPAILGSELNASITPIRDALHRLVGERLVAAPRNEGFRVPAPTEAELRDLYWWNGALVDLALRARPFTASGTAPPCVAPAGEGRGDAGQLFLAIATRAGSSEHQAAIASLNDRLGAYRVVEGDLLEDAEQEIAALARALREGRTKELRRGIAAYHRRRRRHVPELLAAARRPRASSLQTFTE